MFVKSKRFKTDTRLRKKIRLRKRIRGSSSQPRLCVFKSSKFTYAQVFVDFDGKTVVSASSREKEVMDVIGSLDFEEKEPRSKSSKSLAAARAVGVVIGRRLLEHKLSKVIFDRNGYLYHGRIKAVADGAREAGLQF